MKVGCMPEVIPRSEFEAFLKLCPRISALLARATADNIEVYAPAIVELIGALKESGLLAKEIDAFLNDDERFNKSTIDDLAQIRVVSRLMGSLASEIAEARSILKARGIT